MSVYIAGPGDGDVVGEIHAESWKVAYAGFFGDGFFGEAVERRRGQWGAKLLAESEKTCLVAELGGKPLAFSFFGAVADRAGVAEIFGCYGHPAGWGSGVAGALMSATVDRIRADGEFERIRLWTLRDTPQARRFYVKSGFSESGAVRTYDFGDGTPIAQVEYEMLLRQQ
ncbi:GNAT family N-acetyltransferase [Streptomyces sp. A7024]|uniref:GNAT family N-acetyltransferase n=1 Tax=Streptomyces coryli TaxID=1128680 RepID=A0A6G4U2Z5_9ACTN|nr:GNAT family N-acetyltransferase [Streptomyces coryli]